MPDVNISVPAVEVLVEALSPVTLVAFIVLEEPDDGAVLPSKRPVFRAVVTADSDGIVEFQYSTTDDFLTPEIVSVGFEAGLDEIPVTFRVPDVLSDQTTYFWRARVTDGTTSTEWTVAQSIYLSQADGEAVGAGTWVVSDDVIPAPHLWFSRPSIIAEGEPVAVYGTGFGTSGTVLLGDDAVTTDSWVTVDPDANAYTDDRLIDATEGTASSYHQVITFTIPVDLSQDFGGVLSVETD